jgi:hypothetical protein
MILISCMYHQSDFQAVEQIWNYYHFFEDSAVQVVHFSKSSPSILKEAVAERCKSLIKKGLLIINPENLETYSGTVIFPHISNLDIAVKKFKFDYVYIHTSGDLLCRGNPYEYITHKKFGFASFQLNEASNWPHKKKALESGLFCRNQTFFGRAEGAFFKADFYRAVLSEFISSDECNRLKSPHYAWPIEEVIFSTKAAEYGIKPLAKNLIATKEVKFTNDKGYEFSKDDTSNTVSVDDIQRILNNPDIGVMGIKWFSTDPNDKARLYLKKILGG